MIGRCARALCRATVEGAALTYLREVDAADMRGLRIDEVDAVSGRRIDEETRNHDGRLTCEFQRAFARPYNVEVRRLETPVGVNAEVGVVGRRAIDEGLVIAAQVTRGGLVGRDVEAVVVLVRVALQERRFECGQIEPVIATANPTIADILMEVVARRLDAVDARTRVGLVIVEVARDDYVDAFASRAGLFQRHDRRAREARQRN